MDARSLVTVLLTLFLGTAISLKGAQASTEGCSDITPEPIEVALSDTVAGPICDDGTEWSIGSDFCDLSSFMEYSRCSGNNACDIPASEYLVEGPTYVICRAGLHPVAYFEILLNPVINHVSVPPVVQAGKEVTIFATFAAKLLPPAFPSLIIDVEPSVPTINTSMQIVPNPTNDIEYIILYTFVVPLDFDETTQIRPRFSTLPEDWSSLAELTFEPIGVVFPVCKGYAVRVEFKRQCSEDYYIMEAT